MTPEQFREHGHQAIDWLADYLEHIESYPVGARSWPGSVRAGLPAAAPESGEPFELILRDLKRVIVPGLTHWQSPSFFGYFPSNASPPSILGDLISSGLGVQGMMWSTSPAATELETHVLDWLVDLLGLPAAFCSDTAGGGVIQDTASSSTLCALLAARERMTGFASNELGLAQQANAGRSGDVLVAYTSREAHSSVTKAVKVAGIGAANLRLIDTDDEQRMDAAALGRAMDADAAAGRRPFFVCATIGTTASAAGDPVHAIGEHATTHGAWLHVDAAYAGSACVCEELRGSHDGVELADSYTFNPHKWLLTNFDCNVFYVRDRQALTDTFAINPEYLRNAASEAGDVIDYRDWHIPLGRRFRALKLWFVLRSYGADGLRRHIRRHVELAKRFADLVSASDNFELAAPQRFGLVCFRHHGGDEKNRALLHSVNDGGSAYLTHAVIGGKVTLRLAIGVVGTEWRHVSALWQLLLES